jgi:hypothetical protein
MSSVASAPLLPSALDDDAWEDLLSYIEERRVIPIVGPELLQVSTERGPRLLYDWLAEKLVHEAAMLFDSVPTQMQGLHSVRIWRDRVHDALHAPAVSRARQLWLRGLG